MDILTKIKAQMNDFEEKRKVMVAELQKEFPALLAPLFEKHPLIQSIGWSQYTPYFNDGDECTFSVNMYNLEVNGQDVYDFATEGPERKAEAEFKKVLTTMPDEFYKDLFGDHMQVTVNRDGTIETTEYEHD